MDAVPGGRGVLLGYGKKSDTLYISARHLSNQGRVKSRGRWNYYVMVSPFSRFFHEFRTVYIPLKVL